MEAKIAALREHMSQASGGQEARIEKRIAGVKADYTLAPGGGRCRETR